MMQEEKTEKEKKGGALTSAWQDAPFLSSSLKDWAVVETDENEKSSRARRAR